MAQLHCVHDAIGTTFERNKPIENLSTKKFIKYTAKQKMKNSYYGRLLKFVYMTSKIDRVGYCLSRKTLDIFSGKSFNNN